MKIEKESTYTLKLDGAEMLVICDALHWLVSSGAAKDALDICVGDWGSEAVLDNMEMLGEIAQNLSNELDL